MSPAQNPQITRFNTFGTEAKLYESNMPAQSDPSDSEVVGLRPCGVGITVTCLVAQ